MDRSGISKCSKTTSEQGDGNWEALKAAVDSDNVAELEKFEINEDTIVTNTFVQVSTTYDPDEGTWWESGRTTRYNHTPILHYATKHGKVAIVKHLIDKGFAPDILPNTLGLEDKKEEITPVVLASKLKLPQHVEILKLLLDKGVKAEQLDHDGNTALMLALKGNSVEKAQLLVDHGANINYGSEHEDMQHVAYGALGSGTSWTKTFHCPIHVAATGTLRWCVEKGADIEAVQVDEAHWDKNSKTQYTPLLYAVRKKWLMDRVRALLALKPNVYARSDRGDNVFDLLANDAPSDVINKLVLAYFANIHSPQATEAKFALRPGTKPNITERKKPTPTPEPKVETKKESSSPPYDPFAPKCTAGCGFFGNAAYGGMCSLCYKKKSEPKETKTEEKQPTPAPPQATNSTSSNIPTTPTKKLEKKKEEIPSVSQQKEATSTAIPPDARNSLQEEKPNVTKGSVGGLISMWNKK